MIKDILDNNETTSANEREITMLKEYFPACFSEDGSFDIERFKEYISDKLDVKNEGYELKFLGKNYARLLASIDTTTVVTPDTVHNEKTENKDSENLYITGDNLDGLKHLLKSYAGKIKCIYIDPPYNTGSDGFVYSDRFDFTIDELVTRLSISESQAQRVLDLTKRGSASHSAWLMFMYPRLQLARDLLSDDGVIFISIDDNEQANLKLICDDIFGEENFIANLSVENNPKGRKNSDHVSVSSEYLLMYAKKITNTYFKEIIPKKASDMSLDENNRYVHNSGKRVLVGENSFNNKVSNVESDKNYSVYYDRETDDVVIITEEINEKNQSLIEQGYVRYASVYNGNLMENTYTKQKFLDLANEKALEFAEEKIYEKNFSDTVRIKSQLVNRKYEAIVDGEKKEYSLGLTTTGANTYLKQLFNVEVVFFDASKNREYIKLLMKLIDDRNHTVLDFFSGSSTTADAVMQLNAEDNGKRKFIMVQLPEIIEENKPAYKAGYRTIDQIGRERIIRAAKKIKGENPDTTADLGFKHYFLKEPSGKQLSEIIDFDRKANELVVKNNLVEEFGTDTVFTTWLIRDGYGFSPKFNTINFGDYIGYHMDKHLYLIHKGLDNDAIEAIVSKFDTDPDFNPENVVLFGYSFTWTVMESLQTNLKRLKATEKNLRINFDIRY